MSWHILDFITRSLAYIYCWTGQQRLRFDPGLRLQHPFALHHPDIKTIQALSSRSESEWFCFWIEAHWQGSGEGVCHSTVQALQLGTLILPALCRTKLNCMFCPQEDGFLLVPQHIEIKVCWEYKWGLVSTSGLPCSTSGPDRWGTLVLSFWKITNVAKYMGKFQ